MASYFAVSMIVLAGGALAYMRSARTSQRTLALLTGMTLSWAVATVGIATYWDGRLEPWMRKPGDWCVEARSMANTWVVLVALVLASALLGLLRRLGRFIRVSLASAS
jgi:hypothetical protein